jgi:hypothetical protein
MLHLCIKFHNPSRNGLLGIAIKVRTAQMFRTVGFPSSAKQLSKEMPSSVMTQVVKKLHYVPSNSEFHTVSILILVIAGS